ncbi:MAG: GLUG motif-containing protein [Pseudomonadota bacterium]
MKRNEIFPSILFLAIAGFCASCGKVDLGSLGEGTDSAAIATDSSVENPLDALTRTKCTWTRIEATINTASDLDRLRSSPDRPNARYCKFVLGRDLDLSTWSGAPIGTSSAPFAGLFDGQGHKISNFNFNGAASSNIGLFGYVNGGTIQNLVLENVNVAGKNYVGGLVGYLKSGTISRSSVTGGSVVGLNYVGGLVGYVKAGTVSIASAAATVTSTKTGTCTSYKTLGVGGLAGYVDKTSSVSNSYAKGSVTGCNSVGGLVGNLNGNVSKSYAMASIHVSGKGLPGGQIGGLVGGNSGYGQALSSYWCNDSNLWNGIPPKSAGGEPKSEAQLELQATFVGWDFADIWASKIGGAPEFDPYSVSAPRNLHVENLRSVAISTLVPGAASKGFACMFDVKWNPPLSDPTGIVTYNVSWNGPFGPNTTIVWLPSITPSGVTFVNEQQIEPWVFTVSATRAGIEGPPTSTLKFNCPPPAAIVPPTATPIATPTPTVSPTSTPTPPPNVPRGLHIVNYSDTKILGGTKMSCTFEVVWDAPTGFVPTGYRYCMTRYHRAVVEVNNWCATLTPDTLIRYEGTTYFRGQQPLDWHRFEISVTPLRGTADGGSATITETCGDI